MIRLSLSRILVASALAALGFLSPAVGRAAQIAILPPPVANTGAPGCQTDTLANYVTNYGGLNGCSIGIATFFDFGGVSFTNTNATAADIIVTPVTLPNGDPALTFSSPLYFSTLAGTNSEFDFHYDVDPPIDILGSSLRADPFAGGSSVSEAVCVANLANTNSCAAQAFLSVDPANPFDSAGFGPTHFVGVSTTVTLNGPASIDEFTQSFTVAPVPEPAEIALTGIGGLALIGALRRRRGYAAV